MTPSSSASAAYSSTRGRARAIARRRTRGVRRRSRNSAAYPIRSGMPPRMARIAEESESVSRRAIPGRCRRICPAAAKRRDRDHSRYGTSGNRGLRIGPNKEGPRNTAGRAGSEAAAWITGRAWTRSPSQLGSRRRRGRALAEDTQLATDLAQDGERQVQILVGVGGGHDRAEPGLPLRHGRIADPLRENAALEEPVREPHREV